MNEKKIKKQILSILESEATGKTAQQLSQILGYAKGNQFPEFVRIIAQLEQEEQIIINESGTLYLPVDTQMIEGKFNQNDKGFGFVSTDLFDSDIFIPKDAVNLALNGDTVEVEVTKKERVWEEKSAEGRITQVIARGITRLTGEFSAYDDKQKAATGYYGELKPQNKGLTQLKVYVTDVGLHPVTGEIVVLEIDDYLRKNNQTQAVGHVTSKIGHKDAPGVDILAVLEMFDIPYQFPKKVLEETEKVPETISDREIKERLDLRDLLTITIDGADAKDLDDAISLRELSNGQYELGVHIADVSYYVQENSEMDQEAYERGTSVYLTDRVVPMLPQRLSNGICSLHPNVDRLTISCLMTIDSAGDVISYDILPSVIHSNYRMTYSDVNLMLEEKDSDLITKYETLYPMLKQMESLHHTFEQKRYARGAIDFDTEEAQIIVDSEGRPLDILVRARGVGERMIESFMLMANETVAKHFTEELLPFVYRIHEHPDTDRLQRFLEFVTTFGLVPKGTKDEMKPKNLQNLLAEVENESYAPVVKMMLLRSMQQAKYDVTPIGHYGLAAEDYTHFTSPIRRYPDLIVHRLIHNYRDGKYHPEKKEKLLLKLEEITEHASQMERRSIEAERETDSLKKTEYMQDKVGMIFDGIVSSITGFGMFVSLDNTVEGLVHISTIPDDYYNFISRHLVLIGERTGNTYRIGDRVKVRLIKADIATREIDFELVLDNKRQTKRKKGRKQNKGAFPPQKKGKHFNQKQQKKRKKQKQKKPKFKIKTRKK